MKDEPTTFEDVIRTTPKPLVRIERWHIVGDPDDGQHLTGTVKDHPRFLADTHVRTSTIIARHGEHCIETRNTMYELGEPAA